MLGNSMAFRRLGANPHRLVNHFLGRRGTHADFVSGRQVTPVKSYPMRMDFAHAPTSADRVLLVGEACGLVNPLTGEGIDYALESGQMAAELLGEILKGDEHAPAAWLEHDVRLRRRFQRLFVFTDRIRALYLRPWVLDRLLRLAQGRPELRPLLVDVTMGMRDAAQATSPRALFKILSSASLG
jgi:flavin-dependent dehydrogenase